MFKSKKFLISLGVIATSAIATTIAVSCTPTSSEDKTPESSSNDSDSTFTLKDAKDNLSDELSLKASDFEKVKTYLATDHYQDKIKDKTDASEDDKKVIIATNLTSDLSTLISELKTWATKYTKATDSSTLNALISAGQVNEASNSKSATVRFTLLLVKDNKIEGEALTKLVEFKLTEDKNDDVDKNDQNQGKDNDGKDDKTDQVDGKDKDEDGGTESPQPAQPSNPSTPSDPEPEQVFDQKLINEVKEVLSDTTQQILRNVELTLPISVSFLYGNQELRDKFLNENVTDLLKTYPDFLDKYDNRGLSGDELNEMNKKSQTVLDDYAAIVQFNYFKNLKKSEGEVKLAKTYIESSVLKMNSITSALSYQGIEGTISVVNQLDKIRKSSEKAKSLYSKYLTEYEKILKFITSEKELTKTEVHAVFESFANLSNEYSQNEPEFSTLYFETQLAEVKSLVVSESTFDAGKQEINDKLIETLKDEVKNDLEYQRNNYDERSRSVESSEKPSLEVVNSTDYETYLFQSKLTAKIDAVLSSDSYGQGFNSGYYTSPTFAISNYVKTKYASDFPDNDRNRPTILISNIEILKDDNTKAFKVIYTFDAWLKNFNSSSIDNNINSELKKYDDTFKKQIAYLKADTSATPNDVLNASYEISREDYTKLSNFFASDSLNDMKEFAKSRNTELVKQMKAILEGGNASEETRALLEAEIRAYSSDAVVDYATGYLLILSSQTYIPELKIISNNYTFNTSNKGINVQSMWVISKFEVVKGNIESGSVSVKLTFDKYDVTIDNDNRAALTNIVISGKTTKDVIFNITE